MPAASTVAIVGKNDGPPKLGALVPQRHETLRVVDLLTCAPLLFSNDFRRQLLKALLPLSLGNGVGHLLKGTGVRSQRKPLELVRRTRNSLGTAQFEPPRWKR